MNTLDTTRPPLRRRRRSQIGARWTRLLASLLALGPVVWVLQGIARAADEYEPVNEAARVKTDPNPYILAAYGFIWVAVLAYTVWLGRHLLRAQGDIATLRRKVDQLDGGR